MDLANLGFGPELQAILEDDEPQVINLYHGLNKKPLARPGGVGPKGKSERVKMDLRKLISNIFDNKGTVTNF